MANLNYRIACFLEEAAAIKKEHPNVYLISFDLTECKYSELESLALSQKSFVNIRDGHGVYSHTYSTMDGYPINCMIYFKTKKLLVSQTIQEVEE
jgi:CMP-N-acetylneuraminic acid synthetase